MSTAATGWSDHYRGMTFAHDILQLPSAVKQLWDTLWGWLTGLELSPGEDHWVIQWMYEHPVVSLGVCLGLVAVVFGARRGRW